MTKFCGRRILRAAGLADGIRRPYGQFNHPCHLQDTFAA
jgi:hypothetical protein